MIVVDTNIIVYLYITTEYSLQAEKLMIANPIWVAPQLWRSEFRNVLASYLRKKIITYETALRIQKEAEALMDNNEFEVKSNDVVSLVSGSNCSAYDCEFISLAINLKTKLYTTDKRILREFPYISIPLKN